jgi:RimJ/RimL family protein N-acetyltransferase
MERGQGGEARGIRNVELLDEEMRLRPPRRGEVSLYARWWRDEEAQWGFCAEPRTAEEIDAAFPELEGEARDIGHWIDYVIEVEGRPVGSIWLSHWDLDAATADLNILIGEPEYRRRGVARRAIRLLAGWAFPTMELQRIDLVPREDHVPAIRSYLAAGARMGEIDSETVTFRGEVVCFRRMHLYPDGFGLAGSGAGPG